MLKIRNLFKKTTQANSCSLCNGKTCSEKCLPEVIDEIETERNFYLSPEQNAKFVAWKRTKKLKYIGAIGGHFSVEFMMTGIGEFVVAKCVDGTELNLTEYDKL